jgi:hypothetical protein
MDNFNLCSGFGVRTEKGEIPTLTIDWGGVQKLVDNPVTNVPKTKAQWLSPSSLLSRSKEEQEQRGEYCLCALDFDKNPPTVPELAKITREILEEQCFECCDFELYNTNSATADNPKSRLFIPLTKPLNHENWLLLQQVIAVKFEQRGIIKDKSLETANQVSFLPNGKVGDDVMDKHGNVIGKRIYASASERNSGALNPELFREEMDELQRQADELEAEKAEKAKARTMVKKPATNDSKNLIEEFNRCYDVASLLKAHGYAQRGNRFRHPNSESGSFSASIKDGRVHTLSTSDPLYSDGEGARDAFDVFTVLVHDNNLNAALKDAGDNFLTIGGESWNKVVQREFMQNKAKEKVMNGFDEIPSGTKTTAGQNGTIQVKKNPFTAISFNDLMKKDYIANWLVEDIIERETFGLVFGDSASGKSLLIQDLCFCVSTGIDWHGKPTQQGNVLYIVGEGQLGLQKRFRAISNKYGRGTNNLFISERPAALMCPDDTNEVRELIDQIGNVTLIVIDTLHRNFGAGDENSSKDFAQFLNNIDRQLKPCGATILVIHHSGHGDKERGRGSSAIRAAMDFEYKVEKKQVDKKLCFSNTKMKDFKPPEAMFFDFRTEGDSVVLELDDSYKTKGGTKRDKPLNGNSLKVFQVLNKALEIAGEKPPQLIIDYFEHDRSQLPDKVVTAEAWREFAYPAMTVMGEDEKKKTSALKKAYQRARNEITDRGYTGNHGDYYWLAYPSKADEVDFTELLEELNDEEF